MTADIGLNLDFRKKAPFGKTMPLCVRYIVVVLALGVLQQSHCAPNSKGHLYPIHATKDASPFEHSTFTALPSGILTSGFPSIASFRDKMLVIVQNLFLFPFAWTSRKFPIVIMMIFALSLSFSRSSTTSCLFSQCLFLSHRPLRHFR